MNDTGVTTVSKPHNAIERNKTGINYDQKHDFTVVYVKCNS